MDASAAQPDPLLSATGVAKTYRMGGKALEVLRGVDLEVRRSEFVAIMGRSGSGKSTLLHVLGGLDRADAGSVTLAGQTLDRMNRGELDALRRNAVGFVFQQYHLLPELSAVENVVLAAMLGRGPLQWRTVKRKMKDRAKALLDQVGLSERMTHKPAKLSGGERQRVAIARALMREPALLLADEPTGNLDAETAEGVLALFSELNAAGQTVIMVTHDDSIAQQASRTLRLDHGVMV